MQHLTDDKGCGRDVKMKNTENKKYTNDFTLKEPHATLWCLNSCKFNKILFVMFLLRWEQTRQTLLDDS